jgi:putative addiction module component (TIGR02574 family)
MSPQLDQLTAQALSLEPGDRLVLAQRLWESVEPTAKGGADDVDDELIAEFWRRDAEIESGAVQTFSHEEVIEAARKAIEKK